MRRPLQILLTTAFVLLLSNCGKPTSEESAPAPVSDETPAVVAPAAAPALPRSTSPEGATLFFISPSDGVIVSNPVKVEFGVERMSVVKAGEMAPDSGHHHLLIDTGLPDLTMPIPADEQHRHFGDASTSTEITLEPGQHTLQLLFADYLHIPHDPVVTSETITITVE